MVLQLKFDANTAAGRAQLAVNVGWLRLRLGEAQAAEAIFRAAHEGVLRMLGPDGAASSFTAAPGLARSLCELGRAAEAAELVAQVAAAAERNAGNNAGGGGQRC